MPQPSTKKCSHKNCKNEARYGRLCSKHHSQKYRQTNPERYFYHKLKYSAKRRKHEFLLTFEDYRQFCKDTDYIARKGKTATSLSIDRIDPTKGYEAGNIQVLALAENTRKQNMDRILYEKYGVKDDAILNTAPVVRDCYDEEGFLVSEQGFSFEEEAPF